MIDRDFGHWLAGFIAGEGCFYITRDSSRSVWRARFSMTLRSDDRSILEECQRRTNLGRLHNYFASSSGRQVTRWCIQSRDDCEKLVEILRRFPLRAKKASDFDIWRRAVVVQRAVRVGRADNSGVSAVMQELREELSHNRLRGIVAR